MRFILYFITLIAVLASCNRQQTASSTAPTIKQVQSEIVKADAVLPISLDGLPQPSASMKAYLGTGLWHKVGSIQPGNDAFDQNFPVTDLRFAENGTLQMYKNEQLVGSARWTTDEANTLIYVSSNNPALNSSWRYRDSGFRMVWLGNTELNGTGAQIRWDCHKDK